MKKTLLILLGMALSTTAFSKATVSVERNLLGNSLTSEGKIEHSSCKIFNKNSFFDKKAIKLLKKKGYNILDSVPSEISILSEGYDVDQSTYFTPKVQPTNMGTQNINGRSAGAYMKANVGLEEAIGGLATINLGGLWPMSMPVAVMMAQDKKSDGLNAAINAKLAEILPACELKK
jgi:hypothetical protein